MPAATAFLLGLLYGGICAYAKYRLLWRSFFCGAAMSTAAISKRTLLSFLINVLVFALAFLFGELSSFPLMAVLFGTTFSLVTVGPLVPYLHQSFRRRR